MVAPQILLQLPLLLLVELERFRFSSCCQSLFPLGAARVGGQRVPRWGDVDAVWRQSDRPTCSAHSVTLFLLFRLDFQFRCSADDLGLHGMGLCSDGLVVLIGYLLLGATVAWGDHALSSPLNIHGGHS